VLLQKWNPTLKRTHMTSFSKAETGLCTGRGCRLLVGSGRSHRVKSKKRRKKVERALETSLGGGGGVLAPIDGGQRRDGTLPHIDKGRAQWGKEDTTMGGMGST